MINLSNQSFSVNTHFINSKSVKTCAPCVSSGVVAAAPEIPFSDLDSVSREFQKVQKAALGISTKSCKQSEVSEVTEGNKKYINQRVARYLVGGRLNQCCITPVPVKVDSKYDSHYLPETAKNIDLYKSKTANKFSFGGLMKCGSVWSCPVCASDITEGRRSDVKDGMDYWLLDSPEHDVLMMTVTVPHYQNNSLEEVLGGLTDSLRRMMNRKGFKEFAEAVGLKGRIRTLEVTYGKNGWHPHFHILFFIEKKLTEKELAIFKIELLAQWQSACVSSGLPFPNEHGLDLVNGAQAAAYVSKWGIPEEMTKGILKKGKKEGHCSPFGLLDLYQEGDKNAGERFKEFTKCLKGKRQLVWSEGLRELLKMKKEKTDQEIVDDSEKGSELFASIPVPIWKIIVKREKVCEMLKVCESGKDAFDAWLLKIRGYDDIRRGHRNNKLRQSTFN